MRPIHDLMKKILLMMQMVFAFCSVAQVPTQRIDSLKKLIQKSPNNRLFAANAYMEIADCFSHSHPDSIKKFCYWSLSSLKGLKEDSAVAKIKADAFTNLGLAYSVQGKFIDALNCHYKARPLWEKIKDPEGLTECYNNIAVINKQALNFSEAEKQFKCALNWAQKVDEQNYKAMILNNLGNLYKEQKKYKLALKYYLKSKTIREKLNEPDGFAATLNNIGALHLKLKNYPEALKYFDRALLIVKETNNMRGIAAASGNLGKTYFELDNIDQALEYGLISLENAQEIHAGSLVAETAELLAKVYTKKEEWKNAVAMHELYLKNTDPKRFEDLSRELIKSEFQFDFEKRQNELQFLNAKKLIKANEQKERQLLITVFASILVVVLLVFSFSLFKRVVRLNSQKKIIEKQYEERKILLQEIHHRVKNNFQIISSMLRLQSKSVNNEVVKEEFVQAINRLHAMSFVHELIYKHNSFEEIELQEYLDKLFSSIKKSYPDNMVEISFDGVNEKMNIEKAIPLGIVLNELITNSYKHAFPEPKKDARIQIHLERNESLLNLRYQDNGVGYDPDKAEHSFGTELIHTIVDQLTGKIHYSQEEQWNTQVSLTFEAV